MKASDSKILKIISALNPRETGRLKLALASPYFNAGAEAVRLFDFFTSVSSGSVPGVQVGYLERKQIFEAVFPGESFEKNGNKLNNVPTRLLGFIKDFLAREELAGRPDEKQLLLCSAFKKAGLHKFYEEEWGDLNAAVEKNLQLKAPFNLHQFSVAKLNFENSTGGATDYAREYYDIAIDYLMSECLLSACLQIERAVAFKMPKPVQADFPFLQTALTHFVEPRIHDLPKGLVLFTRLFQGLIDWKSDAGTGQKPDTDTSEAYIREAQGLFRDKRYFPHLTRFQRANVFVLILNFFTRRFNHHKDERYIGVLIDWHRFGEKEKHSFEEGYSAERAYINFVRTLIAGGAVKEAQRFVEAFEKQDDPHKITAAGKFIRLMLLLHENKPQEAWKQKLHENEFSDPRLELSLRVKISILLYELDDLLRLQSYLSKFEKFEKNNPGEGYPHFGNFIKFLKMVLSCRKRLEKKNAAGIKWRNDFQDEATRIRKKMNDANRKIADADWLNGILASLPGKIV